MAGSGWTAPLELEEVDKNGNTALHGAVIENADSTVRALIEAGANVHATNKSGRTPLHLSQSKAIVEELVRAGASVTAIDNDGQTPLDLAYMNPGVQEGTVDALISAGSDVHARDKDDDTVLHVAHDGAQRHVQRRRITNAGTRQDAMDQSLWYALWEQEPEKAERLLDEGAEPNWRHPDCNNQTAFHIAVVRGYVEVVRKLLAKGVFPDTTDNGGDTALHKAVRRNLESLVRDLIDMGANIHAQNKDGKTPLHLAKNKTILRVLVDFGANVGAIDKDGWTTLHHLCARYDHQEGMVEVLVAAGADVHTRNMDGDTALHMVARERTHLFRIDELVAAGADLACTNNAGKTPRDGATFEARRVLDRARLTDHFEVQVPPDRVMLMLIGNGMVGKTTLTKALEHGKAKPVHPVDGRTYGFDSFETVIPHAGKCTMVDFGGQPEFWVPHGLFLGNRSGVYLVVINLGERYSTQRSQLQHWLRFIVSRSEEGTRPQVAVVGSHRGAAQPIKIRLDTTGHTLPSDEREELALRLKQLESISTKGQRHVLPTLQEIVQSFRTAFAEPLDIAPHPFLIESVDPDEMDETELTRLQEWLMTAFDHIRTTRQVPQVCLQVADLVAEVRLTLPPISTYSTVIAALKTAAGDSIDFSNDARNRAILSHLWEAGLLMVLEGLGDTVVLDLQAFGANVIGQLFCPHDDPNFHSLVVREEDGFAFRRSQLERHFGQVRERGRDFGDTQHALDLLTALELIISLPATPRDTVDDPVFAIPGRLSQGDQSPALEKYSSRPAGCWSHRTHDRWLYFGVRLKHGSPLSLISPGEFPRLQHRLSGKHGFMMWRHGLRVCQCTPKGLIEVEGLVELNSTLEHIDVCVRSEVGAEEACIAELINLLTECSRISPHFECGMLMAESLKKHVDTERQLAHISLRQVPDARSQPVEWLKSTLELSRQIPKPHWLSIFWNWLCRNFKWFTSKRQSPDKRQSPINVVVSCPETASLSGDAPYSLNVFQHCDQLREKGRILVAFDRPREPELGLEGQHPVDEDVIWSMSDPRLDGASEKKRWNTVQESVKESVWFYGFRERIKASILLIAQGNLGRTIHLICIKGGPITNLEQNEMSIIVNDVDRALDEIKVDAKITLEYVPYRKFLHEFP